MRLAILGSVALPVPPVKQGGTEWIAYHQAAGLSKKGHKVILVAAQGTKNQFKKQGEDFENLFIIETGKGNLAAGSGLEFKYDPVLMESSRKLRMETAALAEAGRILSERRNDYDIILNNMRGEASFLELARILKKPFVNVCHLNIFPELAVLFNEYKTHLITISNSQRKEFPDLNYLATVYNGVDTDKFVRMTSDETGDYLLMAGSIGRHKNQGTAIRVAKKLGMKLVLAGKIRDKDYYSQLQKDIDGENIRWMGEISFEQKLKLYQNAKAFIFPILWSEPFGLVMIEAMSCGTPVVAFANGAVPEVVVSGKTGFVIENNSEEGMIEAVKNIDRIKRENCRKRVLENFTVEKMVKGYEEALLSLL